MSHPYLVGQPCGSARPDRRSLVDRRVDPDEVGLCGLPSRFVYVGLTPDMITDRRRRKVLGIGRVRTPYLRGSLTLCPDCAYQLSHDMADALIKGKARLERLDVVKFRAHCSHCNTVVHIAWDTDAPQGNPGLFMFCPRCGERTMFAIDPDADYWELMSEAFDKMPVQLLQMLHVEWPRHDRRFPSFRSYVEYQIKQYDNEGDLDLT